MTEPVDAPAPSPKLSITSLTLAIVALAVFWLVAVAAAFREGAADSPVVFLVAAVVGVILGVAAVVTGIVARRRVRRGQAGKGGVALAGIVLGVAATVVPAALVALGLYGLYAGYEEFEHCIKIPETASPRYLCLKECPGILDSLCRKEIGW
jgi:heme/copper-type cytochrome/quinol oxidase subunit 2